MTNSGREVVDFNVFVDRPASLDDLKAYSRMLEQILEDRHHDVRFLVSTTMCRMEAQTHFFDTLYKYARLIDIVRNNPTVTFVNLRPPVLLALTTYLRANGIPFRTVKTVQYWIYRLKLTRLFFLLKVAMHSAFTVFFRWQSRRVLGPWRGKSRNLFFSYYDFRSVAPDGTYRDPYFAPLQTLMKDTNLSYDVVVLVLGPKSLGATAERLHELRKMQKTLNISPFENVVELSEIAKTAMSCVRHWFRSRPQGVTFKGCDVSTLLEFSFLEDFGLRNNWYLTYLMEHVARRIVRQPMLERIYYPYENHPWERMLNRTKYSENAPCRTIGYQHTSFSLKLLNHFPTDFDKAHHVLPNKVITSGPILKNFLAEYGSFPSDTLVSGCALRHSYLYSQKKFSNPVRTRRLAFSFSSDGSTYPAIMRSLIEFFAGSEYTILLKPHPLLKDLSLFSEDLPKNFVDANSMSWKDLFASIDLVFYHDNSLGIEAFAYQVPSCDYQIAGEAYNCYRLFAYPGDYMFAYDQEDLERVLANLEKRSDSNEYVEKENSLMRSYVRDYFIEPTEKSMSIFLNL